VERLGERHHSKAAEPGGKILRAKDMPLGICDATSVGLAFCFLDHAAIPIDADNNLQQWGQQQRDAAGAAANIEQPPTAIQTELRGDHVGHRLRIRQPPDGIEPGGSSVNALIPLKPRRHAVTLQAASG
jgi:hypothetical protein